jgi:protoporphyrinogen IX oxidase
MSLDEFYPWFKALHVVSVLLFIGGVLLVSVFLNAVTSEDKYNALIARKIRAWDQMITTPAMLLTWALGITLASVGHWFSDHWLQGKLVFVVVLSGIHGMQSGRLRRLAAGIEIRPIQFLPAILICVVVIVVLVIIKP